MQYVLDSYHDPLFREETLKYVTTRGEPKSSLEIVAYCGTCKKNFAAEKCNNLKILAIV